MSATLRFIITFAPAMIKILIIQTASLGDVVLASALANSIQKHYPDSSITMLVKKQNEAVLAHNEVVDIVLSWDKSAAKYKNLFHLLKRVRKNKYDFVINLHRFASSGFIAAFSKAKMKVGFKQNPFSFLFNKKISHTLNNVHETNRNLELGRLCLPDIALMQPVITPKEPANSNLLLNDNPNIITVFPGSLWETKKLPVDKWTDLAASIPSDFLLLVMGSVSDSLLADQIVLSRPKNTMNLCGKLSINESAWIMQKALMNYCNDSAPTHLASAVNAPVTTVFCSTIPEFGFTPLSDFSFIVEVTEKLSCRPCGVHGHRVCPEKHFNCGTKIETKQLLEGIKDYVRI